MSNLASAFQNGKAYIPFFICGDPDLAATAAAVRAAVQNGAAMVELNIPFTSVECLAADGDKELIVSGKAVTVKAMTDGALLVVR